MNVTLDKSHYWIGLTDLEERNWRWSYDQTLANFKDWLRGYGSKGTDHNCGLMHGTHAAWIDTACRHTYKYVCESHYCKYNGYIVEIHINYLNVCGQ